MLTHPSILALKIPWTEEPNRLQSRGSQRVWQDWATSLSLFTFTFHFHFSLSFIGEGNGNPLQCSWLENPRDGWAWWAAVYGVAQSRSRLKLLSSSSSSVYMSMLLQFIPLFTSPLSPQVHSLRLHLYCCSVSQLCSTLLWPHGLQHHRLPSPSSFPRDYSNSCPLSWWCHPTVSSSVITLSSCLQCFPASGSFLMSQLFASGGQRLYCCPAIRLFKTWYFLTVFSTR